LGVLGPKGISIGIVKVSVSLSKYRYPKSKRYTPLGVGYCRNACNLSRLTTTKASFCHREPLYSDSWMCDGGLYSDRSICGWDEWGKWHII